MQFGRFSGSGDAAITLTGRVGDETIELVRELHFPKHSDKHAFVPRLWATRRVGYLLDQIRLHGESDELREEVVRLARQYGIVTPYTSYLIIEDERRRDVPAMSRTLNAPAELDAEGHDMYQRNAARPLGDAGGRRRQVGGHAARSRAVERFQARRHRSCRKPARRATGSGHGRCLPGAVPSCAAARSTSAAMSGSMPACRRHAHAPRVEIEVGSDEYFELIRKHKDATQWLSVGRQMQLVIDNTVYVVQ